MRHWWQLTEAWQNKLASLKTLPTKWLSDRPITTQVVRTTNTILTRHLNKWSKSFLTVEVKFGPGVHWGSAAEGRVVYIRWTVIYVPRYRTTTINASLKVFVCRNTFCRSRCSCLPHSLTFCHTRGKALFSIVLPIHTPCSASNELWNTFFKGTHSCWFLISCKQ